MLEQGRADLNRSFVVADRSGDVELLRTLCRSSLVRTGYGVGELDAKNWSHQPDFVAADRSETVAWILLETAP